MKETDQIATGVNHKSLSFIGHSGPGLACPVLDTGESSELYLESL